jgi:hypothetical protein
MLACRNPLPNITRIAGDPRRKINRLVNSGVKTDQHPTPRLIKRILTSREQSAASVVATAELPAAADVTGVLANALMQRVGYNVCENLFLVQSQRLHGRLVNCSSNNQSLVTLEISKSRSRFHA